MARNGHSRPVARTAASPVPTRKERKEREALLRASLARINEYRTIGGQRGRMAIPKKTAKRSRDVQGEIAKGNRPVYAAEV